MQAGGQSPPLGAAVGLELTHRNNPHGTCHSRPNPGWTRHVHGAKEGNITLAPGAKAARPSTTTSTTSRLLSSPPARPPSVRSDVGPAAQRSPGPAQCTSAGWQASPPQAQQPLSE